MEKYFQYLTILNLVKENINKNKELSRISLILLDNCFELFCFDYIKRTTKDFSMEFKKKLDSVIKYNNNKKIINQYKQSIILLFHYFRNNLFHKGDLKGIELIYSDLSIYFDVIIDILKELGHKKGLYYNRNEDYSSLFNKYFCNDSKKNWGGCFEYSKIVKLFDKMKFNINEKLVKNSIINMLNFLFKEFEEDLNIITNCQKCLIEDELQACFDNHPQKHNEDFENKYKKYIKDINKIKTKLNNLIKNKRNSKFFSFVLKLESQLIFLLNLIEERVIQAEMYIDMQIDELREMKYEKNHLI